MAKQKKLVPSGLRVRWVRASRRVLAQEGPKGQG